MQNKRGIQGGKENRRVLVACPSSEPSGRRIHGESIWHRHTGKSARLDFKTSGTQTSWVAWKDRMRARTEAMRKVKGKITKCEEREDREWVTEESIKELVPRAVILNLFHLMAHIS